MNNPDRNVLTPEFKKKVTKKTMGNYSLILNAMQPDKWYKVTEFVDMVDVKESRIKILLRQLAEQGYVETTGTTKGKMYKKL